MQNASAQNGTRQAVVGLSLSLIFVFLVFFNGNRLGAVASKAAAAGASIEEPKAAASYISRSFSKSDDTKIEAFSASEAEPDKKTETVVQTVAPAQYETPADILKMAEEYQKKYKDASHTGEIKEIHYSSSNANVKSGSVFVKNTTSSHSLNIKSILSKRATLKIEDKSKPSVLIFHTHTTESYEMADNGWYTSKYATRSENPDRNMVRVGNAIEKELTNAGFSVIHDTTVHDLQYNGAYSRSRKTVEKILRENPSIQVVLDVHRDAIYQQDGTHIKTSAEINGKKSAQVMIIAGCVDGDVEDFPRWEENLVFALQLHKTAEDSYKGIMRPILFCNRKYNMDVTPCSLLLEFGSDSNTLDEAVYAGSLMGKSLALLLEDYVEK